MRRGSDSSGRSMGMRVEAAIMPVRRPKVNIGRYSNGLFVTCDRAFSGLFDANTTRRDATSCVPPKD